MSLWCVLCAPVLCNRVALALFLRWEKQEVKRVEPETRRVRDTKNSNLRESTSQRPEDSMTQWLGDSKTKRHKDSKTQRVKVSNRQRLRDLRDSKTSRLRERQRLKYSETWRVKDKKTQGLLETLSLSVGLWVSESVSPSSCWTSFYLLQASIISSLVLSHKQFHLLIYSACDCFLSLG